MKFPDIGGSGGVAKKDRLSLKDGESARGVFRGDPHPFRQHWINNQSSFCPGKGGDCPLCASGDKSAFRFRINFVFQENGAWVAKVWEQGWKTYADLKSLHESDYDLEKTVVKVSRRGSGKNDTSYSILPVPNGVLNAADIKAVAAVSLHDLSPREKSEAEEDDTPDFVNEPGAEG